jgi:anti-sigma factor RsiW
MERNGIHALTPAYALDALDNADERVYEEHLARCPGCQEELAELRETAAMLAFAADGPAPPAALKGRILASAREERGKVLPFRTRRAAVVVSGFAAAAAAAVALGIGIWAASLSSDLDREREKLAILADPSARALPLAGATGRVVVARDGDAVLVVSRLGAAPKGKTYEIWVIAGGRAAPAGLFGGAEERNVVLLERRVLRGAQVAVTLERAGGVDQPTDDPLFATQARA